MSRGRSRGRTPRRPAAVSGKQAAGQAVVPRLPVDSPLTLGDLIGHFVKIFGRKRLYFTAISFDKAGEMNGGANTFADDNFDRIKPWVLNEMAKMASGSVVMVSLVARVFDFETMVEAQGPRGLMEMPAKDLYMFWCQQDGVVGFDAAQTIEIHCTDAASGELQPAEQGVRYRSSKEFLRSL